MGLMPPYRLLTVCTGNICRSPAAAVLLRRALAHEGLGEQVEVGSAGTSWEAEGAPMDDRTELALEHAGYAQPFEHEARTIHLTELLAWDLVLAMTPEHAQTLRRMADQTPPGRTAPEIALWRRFEPGQELTSEVELAVEDPWYEGQGAFDRTVRDMHAALPGIIAHVRAQLSTGDSAVGDPAAGDLADER